MISELKNRLFNKKEKVENESVEVDKKQVYKKNVFIFVLLPIILELIIESLNRGSVIDSFKFMFTRPLQFYCNVIIIAVTISIALVLKSRMFYVTVVSAAWLIMGIVNRILLLTRVTPFNASDLKLITTGTQLIDQYFTTFLIILSMIGLILLGLVIFILFIKGPKVRYKINYWKNLLIVAVVAAVCVGSLDLAMDTGILAEKFTNLTTAYNEYGFIYCFGSGLFNSGVKKPDNYSENTISEIIDVLDKYEEDKNKNGNTLEDAPNILFLQLESFFDINKAENIEFNKDPIPYFNKLKEEYPSGYLNVFNVGYGTCNTEFEIMTSMNLDDFGPGEMPYKSILKTKTCESVCYDLKEYGYATHAIHSNDATFYSRKTVFSNIGYDTFSSIEYMNIDEDGYTYEGWVKDKYLTDEIIKCLDSTEESDYIYTISVQGHGSYPTSKVLENPEIQILSGINDTGRKNAIEYYSNQIHEMDQFVKDLTNELSKRDEKTILVMYGDHLPSLGFTEDELSNGSLYQTEYIIWNNFGLDIEDEDIRSYQLTPKVLEALNITSGVLNKYHQVYKDKDKEEYLSGLANLEYDILYGDQIAYGGVNPFNKTKLQMGIDEITIDDILPVTVDEKQYVEIKGKNFTKYSNVFVNGELKDTEFVDATTLRIKYDKLVALDTFLVKQLDKDSGYVVGSTKEYLYYGENE